MKIKTKLSLIAFLPILLFLIIAATTLATNRYHADFHTQMRVTNKMIQTAFELHLLAHDYL